ncbi:MAG: ABC-F family ATP-binding cassette domain-containing protein [Holophagales bacterium]|nr:ABC-F family ATP-binding cassette domain-containing protein [Holophagales bacterium]
MLYRLERVQKGFGARTVLADATWQHDPGRVAGLVGRNGAGKSTLLRIVQGLVEPDAGRVLRAGGTTFASLEQAVEPEGDEPLREFVARAQEGLRGLETEMRRLEVAIASSSAAMATDAVEPLLAEHDALRERFERNGGYEADARVERVLLGVGLPGETWDRPVGELSGGQKHRAQMARLLLGDASVLLLDEPTNHLDVAGLEFLETWLVERKNSAAQAALVVSHDRQFLNAVADRIVEVAHGVLEEYPGDYDAYRRLKAERDRVRARAAEEQRKLVERTEDFIRRNIAGQKTRQAQARRKMLAKLERVEAPREDANEVVFRFEEARASGDRVLELRGLVPGYPETGPLLAPVSFLLRRGERIALWGPNGCGKTTLLKTIARILPPVAGSAVPGTGVIIGYYDQEMRDLPTSWTVLDVVRDLDPSLLVGEARDFLALFDFRGDEVEQKVGTLSGGEKGRLSLARIVFGGANLLLLDEPTNHLDLDSRERLEEALLEFEGTIVFVSHDRWFVDRIATHVLDVQGRDATLWPGGFTELSRRRAAEKAVAVAPARAAHADAEPKPMRRPDRQADRQRAKARREVEALEEEVSLLEERIREIDAALADPSAWKDGPRTRELIRSRDETRTSLDARCAAWEEAVQRLEQEVPA